MLTINVLSPELRTWAILTAVSAGLLLACAVILLLIDFIRKTTIRWQNGACVVGLVIAPWSFLVAQASYQQWFTIVDRRPAHGLIAYEHAFADTYSAALGSCQLQFALTAIVIVLLLAAHVLRFSRTKAS